MLTWVFFSSNSCELVSIGMQGTGHWVVLAHQELSILFFLGELLELVMFLGTAAPAASSHFRSTADRMLLRREFPLFLGDTPISSLFRSLVGSSSGKEFFLLGRPPLPVLCSGWLLTSSSLEIGFFLLGLGRDRWGFHSILLRSLLELSLFLLFSLPPPGTQPKQTAGFHTAPPHPSSWGLPRGNLGQNTLAQDTEVYSSQLSGACVSF